MWQGKAKDYKLCSENIGLDVQQMLELRNSDKYLQKIK